MSTKPYGMGVNGHANCCDCTACADVRATYVAKTAGYANLGGHVHSSRTVYVGAYMVRAHFRKNPRHLTKFPNTKKAVQAAITRALSRKP